MESMPERTVPEREECHGGVTIAQRSSVSAARRVALVLRGVVRRFRAGTAGGVKWWFVNHGLFASGILGKIYWIINAFGNVSQFLLSLRSNNSIKYV